MEDLTNSESKIGGIAIDTTVWDDQRIDKEAKSILRDRRLG